MINKNKKGGLGRGLSALIPEDEFNDMNDLRVGEVLELSIKEVYPNEDQPRRHFDEDAIHALAESIKIHGIVQPILVKKIKDKYMIIAGERRWRAAGKAKLDKIPAIVKEVDDISLAQISLIENIQREDLNDIEEAFAYQTLIDRFGLKHDHVADAVGKSRSYVANTLRLLKLEQSVRSMIMEGKLSGGHGRVLLREDMPDKQVEWAKLVHEKGMSVRELETLLTKGSKSKQGSKKIGLKKPFELITFEQELKEYLGTKVTINHAKNKGKIEIEYYNDEEFDRILNLIKK